MVKIKRCSFLPHSVYVSSMLTLTSASLHVTYGCIKRSTSLMSVRNYSHSVLAQML